MPEMLFISSFERQEGCSCMGASHCVHVGLNDVEGSYEGNQVTEIWLLYVVI